MQISENCVNYHKGLKPISVATIAIAESATVPVSVHLDHAESEDLVKQALDLGYDSVMFDVPVTEAKEVLIKVKHILEQGNFPTKCKVGNIYDKLNTISL